MPPYSSRDQENSQLNYENNHKLGASRSSCTGECQGLLSASAALAAISVEMKQMNATNSAMVENSTQMLHAVQSFFQGSRAVSIRGC